MKFPAAKLFKFIVFSGSKCVLMHDRMLLQMHVLFHMHVHVHVAANSCYPNLNYIHIVPDQCVLILDYMLGVFGCVGWWKRGVSFALGVHVGSMCSVGTV